MILKWMKTLWNEHSAIVNQIGLEQAIVSWCLKHVKTSQSRLAKLCGCCDMTWRVIESINGCLKCISLTSLSSEAVCLSALCLKILVRSLVCEHGLRNYRKCVTPCPHFIIAVDSHPMCVFGWGACKVSPQGGWLWALQSLQHLSSRKGAKLLHLMARVPLLLRQSGNFDHGVRSLFLLTGVWDGRKRLISCALHWLRGPCSGSWGSLSESEQGSHAIWVWSSLR